MTGKERIARQLRHEPVDRIGAHEEFWSFTRDKWEQAGKIPKAVSCDDHFNFDFSTLWIFNLAIDPTFQNVLIDEDEETQTWLNGNGAKLRTHKTHASTPEHVGYAIANREDWNEKARPFLRSGDNRYDAQLYARQREAADRAGRFFFASGVNVFEAMHPICGHENLLMGMALDPDWVLEMADVYSDLMIAMWEDLFATSGKPDGLWFYEDMGFKGRPFMSPDMYREMILPAHKKTIDFAHAQGLPVVMHSCGFVEPLLPGMIEAGIDCLQAMEVKAGMDLLRIHKTFGEKIALMGGLDVRPVASNDRPGIKRELEWKIPIVKQGNGFIFHSDHSIPESTEYDTYAYFLELGRKLGTY